MASHKVLSRKLRRRPSKKLRPRNGRLRDKKPPIYYSSTSNNKCQNFVKIEPVKPVSSSKRTRHLDVPSKIASKIPSSTIPAKRPRLINLTQVQNSSIENTLQKHCQPQAKTRPLQKRQISAKRSEPVTSILVKNKNSLGSTKRPNGVRNSKRIRFLEGTKGQGSVIRVNRASRQALDLCQEGNIKVAQTDSMKKMLCLLSLGLIPNTDSKKIQPPFVALERLPRNRVKNFKLWQESWINNSKKIRNNAVKPTVSVAGTRRSLRNNIAPVCVTSDKEQKPDPLRLEYNMTTRQYQTGDTDHNNRISSCLRRSQAYHNNNIENEPNRAVPVRKVAETIATRFRAKLICVPRKSTTKKIKPEQDPPRIVPTFSIVTKVKKKNTDIVCIDLTAEEPHDTYIKGVRSRLSNCDTTIHIICS